MRNRLGSPTSHPHTCVCGGQVDARGLHGLTGKKSTPTHIRHSMLNDILWRAVKKAQVPACKVHVGLSRINARRPDGATLVPWARGKPKAWDVTVPDTYAQSHVNDTSIQAGTAADGAAAAKKVKYTDIANTHMFISVAIETGEPWNVEAIELIQEIGRRMENLAKQNISFNASQSPFKRATIWPTRARFKPNPIFNPRKTVSNKPHI